MNGLKMLAYSAIDWIAAYAHDPDQRWKLDCPHCNETWRSRSYNVVLTKHSLHHEFADGHPGRDEMTDGEWSNRSDVQPELVAGTTHYHDYGGGSDK